MVKKMKLFGTDGIRGRAGEFPLDERTIPEIGRAIAELQPGTILVGRDTRVSSPQIFDLLEQGITEAGSRVEDAGVLPTPAVAMLTQRYRFAGAVMISASHNPYEDNGIKVFRWNGQKLSDDEELAVEQRTCELLTPNDHNRKTGPEPGRNAVRRFLPEWIHRYTDLLLSQFAEGPWLKGKHIVVDCANGSMTGVAPGLLERLGARVTAIHAEPSGMNINQRCGAVHPESLLSAMAEHPADFGVAYDGDGDRSMFVSPDGRLIDGDAVLLLMARRLKRCGKLKPPLVVGTLMTNYNLERMLGKEGIGLVRVQVGDRFILEEMRRSGGVLGGEPSGHIIFSDFQLSGDGLLTTLKVAEALVNDQVSLDELTRDWRQAPQLLENIHVREKIPIEQLPAVQQKISEIQRRLEGSGRIVIRYSGTEPLLRVMIESDDALKNRGCMDEMLHVIRAHLGTEGAEV